MKRDKGALFILSDAPQGDPLDCVFAATPFLAPHYGAIQQVGPGRAVSVRAARRRYRPGVDCMLYDFTAPHDHSWAFDMLRDAPAAILLGCSNPAQGAALADLRSAQRYAADGLKVSPDATVGVLDAAPASGKQTSLTRPAALITPSANANDLILAVAPGAIETAYAALLGLVGHDAPMTILVATRRDANDLTDIAAAFGMSAAHVRYTRTRAGLVAAMPGACGLIDISDGAALAASDASFVAGCLGAPVLKLTAPGGAGQAALAFAAAAPRRDPAGASAFAAKRPLASFANDLQALIEAGFARAATHMAVA